MTDVGKTDATSAGRMTLDRRRFGMGLTALTAGSPLASFFTLGGQGPLISDPQTVENPTAAPGLDPSAIEAGLLANLFTRMAVTTRLNGVGPFNFVIDTGATRTAIARETAEALGLEAGPDVLVHGVTSAEIAPTVHLARLDAAGRRFTDLTPCLFSRAELAADGLLGLDVLSRYELEMDLARRTMSLTPSGPDRITVGHAFSTPSRLSRERHATSRRGRFGQLVMTNVRADGVTADCFVDSGAQFSIGNHALRRAVQEKLERPGRRAPVSVFGVTGQILHAEPGGLSQLEINGMRLGPTPLLFADLHAFRALDIADRPALLLGADVLSRFRRVSLDFGWSRMSFGGLRRAGSSPARA